MTIIRKMTRDVVAVIIWKLCAFLVRMENGATAVESMLAANQDLNRNAISMNHSISRCVFKELKMDA
jgi:hypothetical protein